MLIYGDENQDTRACSKTLIWWYSLFLGLITFLVTWDL